MILQLIIIAALLLDMFLTYDYLQLYQKRFPFHDWTLAEANPLIRFMVRKLGLGQGIGVSAVIIIGIMLPVLALVPEAAQWFFLGLYYSVNVQHIVNNRAMKKLLKQKESKGGKK